MELLISKIISSVIEIILMSLIPFIWWLVTARKEETFFSWIGLKKIDRSKLKDVFKYSSIVTASFLALSFYMLYTVKGVEALATSDFDGMGVKAIGAILVYALFNTALPEEILFRGFILKRFAKRFGFKTANYIQCILFGWLHGAMFMPYVGAVTGIIITVFTMTIAYSMAYVNEKKADGSILASWGIHSVANIFSGLVAAFSLI